MLIPTHFSKLDSKTTEVRLQFTKWQVHWLKNFSLKSQKICKIQSLAKLKFKKCFLFFEVIMAIHYCKHHFCISDLLAT